MNEKPMVIEQPTIWKLPEPTLEVLLDMIQTTTASDAGLAVNIDPVGDVKVWFINPKVFQENEYAEAVSMILPKLGPGAAVSQMFGVLGSKPVFDDEKMEFFNEKTIMVTDWSKTLAMSVNSKSTTRMEFAEPFINKEQIWPFDW